MKTYYKAKHILLEDKEDADYVYGLLNQNQKFEELAREYSSCDSALNGGDLGKFPSGTMLPEFEKALYHMSIGEIKNGVITKFGVHIIWRLA